MSGPPVDLPNLDETVTRLPEDIRKDIATAAASNLYAFARGVMGFRDITPSCHGPLCTYLDTNPKRFKLVLMPRGHFKSSVATISRTLQKVVQNPEQRILLANETATNSERFLAAIKSTVETNKVFRTLYSHVIPRASRPNRWSNQELVFERKGSYPEPTIDTIGMTGAYTSRHYNHLAFDDLISEEAAKSKLVMDDVITRVTKLMSLMVDPDRDTADIIGTRWAFYDVYSYIMEWLGDNLARFIRGAIEVDLPIFPVRFSLETLSLIRNNPRTGEYSFSCLYLNNPRNPELQDFNVNDLRFWRLSTDEESAVLYGPTGEIIRVVELSKLDVITTVDVRYSEIATSDRDAVVTTGTTEEGDCLVLDTWCKRANPTEQIDYLIQLIKKWHPRVFGIPKVGYELMAMKYNLRAACERAGVYANVVPVRPGGAGKPHIRGLQPVAATGHLYILATQHQLRTELSEYPLGQYDDVADALALQLQLWRGLLSEDRMKRYRDTEKMILRRTQDYGFSLPMPGDSPNTDDDYDPDDFRYGPIHEYAMPGMN